MDTGFAPFMIAMAAGGATLLGGALALRLGRRVDHVLGFSAGAVTGVALFDLAPEALKLAPAGQGALPVMAACACGFCAVMLFKRARSTKGAPAARGEWSGPASLTLHSLLDGLSIGVAFQASAAVGWMVAAAVLAHDLSDGLNTVNLSLLASSDRRSARAWLAADAAAPLAGVGAGRFVHLPDAALSLVLAAFSGFLLYIGASTLVPHSYRRRPALWTSLSTALGFAFVYGVVLMAQDAG